MIAMSEPIAFCVLCSLTLVSMLVSFCISKHVQREYPEIWKSFGFPSDKVVVIEPKHESMYAKATMRALPFLWSKNRRELHDLYLDRLVFLYSLLMTLVVPVFGYCVFLTFRGGFHFTQ